MRPSDKCKKKIQSYTTFVDLARLWNTHMSDTKDPKVEIFWKSGKLLEYTILRAFELEGANVTWPYDVHFNKDVVEQIDGAVTIDNLHVLCECKDYKDNVNIEPFAKMRNQLMRRPATVVGCIFVNKGYTEPAISLSRFCAPQTILLWEGDEIAYCIEHGKMIDALKIKLLKAAQEFDFHYNTKPILSILKI